MPPTDPANPLAPLSWGLSLSPPSAAAPISPAQPSASADGAQLWAPLMAALGPGLSRLVARPGRVMVEGPLVPLREAAVAWPEVVHLQARRQCTLPRSLAPELVASTVGDALVLRCAPQLLNAAEWAAAGVLSPLAWEVLNGGLALGCNLAICPAGVAGELLAASLAGRGQLVAGLAPDDVPLPPGWLRVRRGRAAARLGCDRLAVWGATTPRRALAALATATGAVACLPARRLDQLLMRCELWGAAAAGDARLQVVANLQLVVVMGHLEGRPAVVEIAELALSPEGYRPRSLFVRPPPPALRALVPVGLPSFVDALPAAARQALVGVAQARAAAPAAPAAAPVSPPPTPGRRPARPPWLSAEVRPSPASSPSHPPAHPSTSWDVALAAAAARADLTSPGWELEHCPAVAAEADAVGPAAAAGQATEAESEAAARYGLGPPPPPPPHR